MLVERTPASSVSPSPCQTWCYLLSLHEVSGGGGTGVQAARDAGGVEDTESQRGSNNVQHGPEEADQVVPEDVPGVPDVPDVPEDFPEHDDQDVQHGPEEADQVVPEDVPEDDDQDVHRPWTRGS